jgi:nucleoside-triphosphatase THEP1
MTGGGLILLWAGAKHSGKTTGLREVVRLCRRAGLAVAGVLAPGVYEGGELAGFDVVDLSTGRREGFLRRAVAGADGARVGEYVLDEEGGRLGRRALSDNVTREADLVIVDEFGPLELAGDGWRDAVDRLARRGAVALLLVVREALVDRAAELYGVPKAHVLPAREAGSADRALALLLSRGRDT